MFKGCQFFPAIFCAARTYLWQNGPEDRSEGLSFARALVRNHTKEKNFIAESEVPDGWVDAKTGKQIEEDSVNYLG